MATYFDLQVSLIKSGLFDIVSHLDFVERNGNLRGYATRDQYVRVAEALDASDTVPEINGSRLLKDYGKVHPCPAFLDVLVDHGVEFTAGTDAHKPSQIRERTEALSSLFEDRRIDPLTIPV